MSSVQQASIPRHGLLHEAVRVTSPAPRDLWEAAIAADPNALVFQTPKWTDCVCAYDGYEDASRLDELPGGRRLVLPMVRRRNRPGPLAIEASLPHRGSGWDSCPRRRWAEDLVAVFGDLAGRPVVRTSLRPSPLDAPAWAQARPPGTVAVPRLAHVLELEGSFGQVWKEQFKGAARTAVRKAERSGLTVERDTSGKLVPVVYELFERSIDRWARQQHEPLPLARWRRRRQDPFGSSS